MARIVLAVVDLTQGTPQARPIVDRIVADSEAVPEAPEGQAYLEGGEDAVISGTWDEVSGDISTPPMSLEDARAQKLAAIHASFKTRMDAGYPVPGTSETLQVRSADDKANWLTLKDAAQDAIDDGRGDDPCQPPPRTTSNGSVPCTWNEAKALMIATRTWGGTMMATFWTLKDMADAAPDRAALDAIDPEAPGIWP